MATIIEIEDDLARETQAVADRDGLTMARYIAAALAHANAERRAAGGGSEPLLMPPSRYGGGLVGGMTVREAIELADLEYDLKKAGRSEADADAAV